MSDFTPQSDKSVSRETFWYDGRSAQTYIWAAGGNMNTGLAQTKERDRLYVGREFMRGGAFIGFAGLSP